MISHYGTVAKYGTATYSLVPAYAGSYPRPISDLSVFIDGVDVTAYIQMDADGLSIAGILSRQIDTCSFLLVNAGALSITEWDEVLVFDGTTKIFAGYIQTLDDDNAGGGLRVDIRVGAADYACYLDHVYVKKEWTGAITDAAILAYFFATYWPYINATNFVTSLKSYPKIRFNRLTLRQVVDQLADAANGDWYIDYERNLHFFFSNVNPAPFGLSSAPDMTATLPFGNMVKNLDGTGVINRVEVVGGNYLSANTTIYIQGTGQDPRVILPFKIHAEDGYTSIRVWRNDGTLGVPVWTPMTVKVGYIELLAAATDVLFYYPDKVLEQQAPWPALANAIKISCRYEVPLRTRYTDDYSVAFYNGIYFDGVIVDESIVDKLTARAVATGRLAEVSYGSTALTCDVYAPGLYAGMYIAIFNPNLNINGIFLIQRVTAKFKTGGYATWSLSLGIYRPDLIDFLIKMARGASPVPPWRDDEVLDELLQRSESMTVMTESTPAPGTHTGNYKWGVDADHAKWSYARWS